MKTWQVITVCDRSDAEGRTFLFYSLFYFIVHKPKILLKLTSNLIENQFLNPAKKHFEFGAALFVPPARVQEV